MRLIENFVEGVSKLEKKTRKKRQNSSDENPKRFGEKSTESILVVSSIR